MRRFLELGLLKISGERPRGGRAVKLYRSAADLFFIPYEATSAETLEAAMAERDAYWEATLRRGVVRARAQAVGGLGHARLPRRAGALAGSGGFESGK